MAPFHLLYKYLDPANLVEHFYSFSLPTSSPPPPPCVLLIGFFLPFFHFLLWFMNLPLLFLLSKSIFLVPIVGILISGFSLPESIWLKMCGILAVLGCSDDSQAKRVRVLELSRRQISLTFTFTIFLLCFWRNKLISLVFLHVICLNNLHRTEVLSRSKWRKRVCFCYWLRFDTVLSLINRS